MNIARRLRLSIVDERIRILGQNDPIVRACMERYLGGEWTKSIMMVELVVHLAQARENLVQEFIDREASRPFVVELRPED